MQPRGRIRHDDGVFALRHVNGSKEQISRMNRRRRAVDRRRPTWVERIGEDEKSGTRELGVDNDPLRVRLGQKDKRIRTGTRPQNLLSVTHLVAAYALDHRRSFPLWDRRGRGVRNERPERLTCVAAIVGWNDVMDHSNARYGGRI